jgi:hypothetical protein
LTQQTESKEWIQSAVFVALTVGKSNILILTLFLSGANCLRYKSYWKENIIDRWKAYLIVVKNNNYNQSDLVFTPFMIVGGINLFPFLYTHHQQLSLTCLFIKILSYLTLHWLPNQKTCLDTFASIFWLTSHFPRQHLLS